MRLIAITLIFLAMNAQAEEAKVTTSQKTEVVAAAETATSPTTEAPKAETKKESEIPLNLESPKKSSEDGHPIFKILLAFSMMGVVGTGAFIFIRKYSKNNYALSKQNQIKVITQHYLGPKKSLAIIRVAGESILIGVTENNINMIKSLSLLDDEVPEATPNNFSEVFAEEAPVDRVIADQQNDEDEEFSIRGIKDVVSKRLKGMRNFQ